MKSKFINIHFFLILSFLIFLFSCEGAKFFSSAVLDKDSFEPIPGAEIRVLNGMGLDTVTDSLGKFRLQSPLIGMMFGGPKFKFEVAKDGFKTKRIKSKYGIDTIFISRKTE